MADWRHTCPICEYEFKHCQCRFAGKAHPDRGIRRRAVLDHLQYLYDEQIAHIQKVEEWWSTSGEGEYQEVVEELQEKFGQAYECARGVLTCPDPNDFCCRGDRKE